MRTYESVKAGRDRDGRTLRRGAGAAQCGQAAIEFCAALLLFLFTFLINTITDVVRTRLRKRLK